MVEITSSPRFALWRAEHPLRSTWHRRRSLCFQETYRPAKMRRKESSNSILVSVTASIMQSLLLLLWSKYLSEIYPKLETLLRAAFSSICNTLKNTAWKGKYKITAAAFPSKLVFAEYFRRTRCTLIETYDILPAIVRNADFIFDLLIALIHADGYVTK